METRFLKSSFSYIGLLILLWIRRDLAPAYMLYLPLLLIPRHQWEEYGITFKNWKLSLRLTALASLVFLLPFIIASIGLTYSRGLHNIQASNLLIQVVGVALPEELFFRGYIQTEIKKRLKDRWKSIILTSVLFTLAHLFKGINPLTIGVFLPSLVFGYLRDETNSIISSVIFHALSNIVFFSLF